MSAEKAFVAALEDTSGHQPLLQGRPQTYGMRAGRVSLLPGQDCGEHSTNNHEEMLVFLAGEGTLIVENGTSLRVGKGRISYIPPESVHNVINTGHEPLVYIYCVAPAIQDKETLNEET